MIPHNPRDGLIGLVGVRHAVAGLKAARDEQKGHHAEGAKEHGGTTTPLVKEEDCRER